MNFLGAPFVPGSGRSTTERGDWAKDMLAGELWKRGNGVGPVELLRVDEVGTDDTDRTGEGEPGRLEDIHR